MSRPVPTILEKISQSRRIKDSEECQVRLVRLRKDFRLAMDLLENIEMSLLQQAQSASEQYQRECSS